MRNQLTGKKLVSLALLVSAAIALCSLFIHPFGPVKKQRSARPLLSGAVIDGQTQALISRSCQNCHSEQTEWPWYSHVAPVSWLIESDVSHARSHMNLSRWDEYRTEQRRALLDEIPTMVRTRSMPPARYLLLHPEAKISSRDIDQLSRWARVERDHLKSEGSSRVGTWGPNDSRPVRVLAGRDAF